MMMNPRINVAVTIFCVAVIAFFIKSCGEDYARRGLASYYADRFEGRKTASGEVFRQSDLTAAHRRLPLGSVVKVTNRENGKSVVVRINDRGPARQDRIIDLSRAAAEKIGMVEDGVVEVKLRVLEF